VRETNGGDSMKLGIQKARFEPLGTILIERSPVTRGKYDITIARAPAGRVRARTLIA